MISGKAKIAGVMGWPVSHSQSPRLHGYWLQHHGIDGCYIPLPVKPDQFKQALTTLPKLGFAGVNITLPHKQAALEIVDVVDPLARQIGAVNTVVVSENGCLSGFNTDGYGFIENLRHGCPDHDVTQGPAVVLGAGGASRAICSSLINAGVSELRLVNRSRQRAEQLADVLDHPISVYDLVNASAALADAHLLVNTTSLGMVGHPSLDLDLTPLPATALVNDIVYTPLQTDLLKAARGRGNPTVDGLGMLLHQARAGFEMWFGYLPDVTEELRTHVIQGL